MIFKITYIGIIFLFLSSCSLTDDNRSNFKIICNIKSPDKKMSVIGIKKGINGGATVGYVYEFYFAKNIESISKEYMFLDLKGLEKYNISWNSINTIKIDIQSKQINLFKNFIFYKENNNFKSYIVNYATFKSK